MGADGAAALAAALKENHTLTKLNLGGQYFKIIPTGFKFARNALCAGGCVAVSTASGT